MKNLEEILTGCKSGSRTAQKALYDYYAPIFLAICRRYIRDVDQAEDVMIKGFFKIFSKINDFRDAGSFEGWMKKIMVNESLMLLRKNKNFHLSLDTSFHDVPLDAGIESNMDYVLLLEAIQSLPDGYRTIFNMYVIEGYKHREIAETLHISINTSKSQLIQAKRKLQQILKKKLSIKIA